MFGMLRIVFPVTHFVEFSHMIHFVARGLCVALFFPLFAGCSDKPKLAPVQGNVTLDGAPLKSGRITFESPGNRPATAKIVDGKIIEATTMEPNDGVPVGSHKVAISANEEPGSAVSANPGDPIKPGANYMGGKSIIPARYNNPETSQLTAEIKPGDNGVEFKLTSK